MQLGQIPEIPLLSTMPASAAVLDVRRGRRLDRQALAAAALDRAAAFAASGLAAGERVVVGHADPVDFLVDLFAAWTAGLCAVAVNPRLAPAERRNVLETTGARAWLDGTVEAPGPGAKPGDGVRPSGLPQGELPALIMMTSGTTGVPKGVMLGLRALEARLALNLAATGTAPLRRSLCVLPVFFGHGLIGNCLTPLAAGATLHLFPAPQVAELDRVRASIAGGAITFMSSVPTFWKMMLRLPPPDGSGLERVHVGSAPLSHQLWSQIAAWTGTRQVFNMFGMTETANWISGGSLDEAAGRDGYVGHAWGGALAILDAGDRVRPRGQGEVLVQTPSRMLGFWNRPELGAAAQHGQWMRTGDIGIIDGSGGLTLVGRHKSEINRAGIKVLAEEVDMLLERHPEVIEACAFGLPDPVAGETVAAAVVLREGATADARAITAWCRGETRAEAVPTRLFVVAALPRNDRGKVVRSTVRDSVLGAG